MFLLPHKVGDFSLHRKLGTGGVAESYLGSHDAGGGKAVVVRRILPFVLRDAGRLATIEGRVRDLTGVRHPYLVHVLDHVIAGDEHFVVEEYVDGVTLEQVLNWCRQSSHQVPHNVFLNIATQICNGLEALHGRSGKGSAAEHVLHYALKPSAIFLTREGKVLVGGYGLARSPTSFPHGGVAAPVPARMEYLSPEQTHPDQKLTPASDIFSLGSLLYELLTLEALFRAESNLQTIHKVRRAEVTSQLLRVKERMPGLDKVLFRALSLNPRHRYQRAFVLREDLRGLMAGYSFAAIGEDTRAFLAPLLAGGAAGGGFVVGLDEAPDAPQGADAFDDSPATRIDPDPMTTAAAAAQALAARVAQERAGTGGDDPPAASASAPADAAPGATAKPSAAANAAANVENSTAGSENTEWTNTGEGSLTPLPPATRKPRSKKDRPAPTPTLAPLQPGTTPDSTAAYIASGESAPAAPPHPPDVMLAANPVSAPFVPFEKPPAPRPTLAPVASPFAPPRAGPPPVLLEPEAPAAEAAPVDAPAPPTLTPPEPDAPASPVPAAAAEPRHEAIVPPAPEASPPPKPAAPRRSALDRAPPPGGSRPPGASPTATPRAAPPAPAPRPSPPPVFEPDLEPPPPSRGGLFVSAVLGGLGLMLLCSGGLWLGYRSLGERGTPAVASVDTTPPPSAPTTPADASLTAVPSKTTVPAADTPAADDPASVLAGDDPSPAVAPPSATAAGKEPAAPAASAPAAPVPTKAPSTAPAPAPAPAVASSKPASTAPPSSTSKAPSTSTSTTSSSTRPSTSTTSSSSKASAPSTTTSKAPSTPAPVAKAPAPSPAPTSAYVAPAPAKAPTTTKATTTTKTSAPAAPVDAALTVTERTNLDAYADAARKGKLSSLDVGMLEGVELTDDQYTRSRALLLQNAQRKGSEAETKRYLDQLMQLPENQYNPVYLVEYARYYVNKGDFARALDTAQKAEKYWARLPSDTLFAKKAEIYEIQAASWQGKFYKSGEDLELLENAIRSWEKYKAHVASQARADLVKKADTELGELEAMKARLQ